MHNEIDHKLIQNSQTLLKDSSLVLIDHSKIKILVEQILINFKNEKHIKKNLTPKEVDEIFLFACMNFCFWGDKEWSLVVNNHRYFRSSGLLKYLNNLLESSKETPLMTVKHLTFDEFNYSLNQHEILKYTKERYDFLQEGADYMIKNYNGSFLNFLEESNFNEDLITKKLSEDLYFFKDIQYLEELSFPFYKKIRVIISQLSSIMTTNCFGVLACDYRLPQYFRHIGILEYSNKLAKQIDNLEIIKKDSIEEISIRASTIVIGETIRRILEVKGIYVSSYKLDLLLWNSAKSIDMIKPHHRTETIYY